jgi:hypothetical protein
MKSEVKVAHTITFGKDEDQGPMVNQLTDGTVVSLWFTSSQQVKKQPTSSKSRRSTREAIITQVMRALHYYSLIIHLKFQQKGRSRVAHQQKGTR